MTFLWAGLALGALWLGALLLAGCSRNETPASVVLYTSVDEPYARAIVEEFTRQTGIAVRLVTDTEATKSVGLAERLRAEKDRPKADVFWSNEPFHTIALADEGVLERFTSPRLAELADQFKDPQGRWAASGYRLRVIAVSPEAASTVTSIEDLTDPRLSGKVAIARPVAGTTAGHVAALYVLWGSEKADAYFKALRDNGIKVVGGNGPAALAVGQGDVVASLTDNDDVSAVASEGGKLSMVVPDQDGMGTLAVPTTVGLVRGAANPASAARLIDHLLSAQTQNMLVERGFLQGALGGQDAVALMNVDYTDVARAMPGASRRALMILEGRSGELPEVVLPGGPGEADASGR